MLAKLKLDSEHKKIYLRRAIFALGLTVLSALQSTPGLLPEIFGARPMLLIPAVVCIAMFERELGGIFFGLFAGILWDTVSLSGGSFNAILLTLCGFACGSLITHLMRNNLVTALLLTAVFTALHLLVYWLRIYIFAGNFGGALSIFTFYIPSCIYTILVMPIFYFSVRLAMKKLQ